MDIMKGNSMNMRKFAAAAGFACGAALAFAPLAAADASGDAASTVDGLLSGVSPAAAAPTDFQISFNGTDLFSTSGNEATATTVAGQYGLAIAYGDGATATAEGGTGDYALASGTDANAEAGSLTAGATGNNYDSAVDIGSNTGGSATGPDGTLAGNSDLYGLGSTSGSYDNAYDVGNNFGTYDGAAAIGGNSNYASMSGDTGTATTSVTNDGALAGGGNGNVSVADTSYTSDTDHLGVTSGYGNDNYAYVDGPDNSTAAAGGGGDTTALVGNDNIAYVVDPSGTTADSAIAGGNGTSGGSSDLAEVLFTHGSTVAQGAPSLYDIASLFGDYTNVPLPGAGGAAADFSSILTELGSLF